MNEDEMFERIKTSFEKCDKDTLIEFTSALIAKLLVNDICLSCDFAPQFVEGVSSKDGCYIEKIYKKYDKSPIRDTLEIDFSKHDRKAKNEMAAELFKQLPRPTCTKL